MSVASRKVKLKELTAAVGREVIIVSISAACLLLPMKLLFHSSKQISSKETTSGEKAAVGSAMTLYGVEFRDESASLILVCSPTCPYCLRSEAFHVRLSREAQRNRVALYVVVPQLGEAAAYLRRVGVSEQSVKDLKDLRPPVPGTPTIMAVNSGGIVRRMWVGVVEPEQEEEILSVIRKPSLLELAQAVGRGPLGVQDYSATVFERTRWAGKSQLIDVRERGAPRVREDALQMPLVELVFRAPFELDKNRLQIVDCANVDEAICRESVGRLMNLGFRVASLGAGAYQSSCKVGRATGR